MTPLFATLGIYFQLPILIVLISLVYSATRSDRWGYIFHEAFTWGLRMVAFLVIIALILFVLAKTI